VRSQSALLAAEREIKLREGVYPFVVTERDWKSMKINGISGVPLGHDGDEGSTRD
jgi:hypothetical protein